MLDYQPMHLDSTNVHNRNRKLARADLQKLSTDKEDIRDLYVDYLTQYRRCLAETEIDKLDSEWCTLDEKWMQIRYPIQVVHDIEYAPSNLQTS